MKSSQPLKHFLRGAYTELRKGKISVAKNANTEFRKEEKRYTPYIFYQKVDSLHLLLKSMAK